MKCEICHTAVAADQSKIVPLTLLSILHRNGYRSNSSDKFSDILPLGDPYLPATSAATDIRVCQNCLEQAKEVFYLLNKVWITPDYIAVTRTAKEVGMGFQLLGLPVALSRSVWYEYVEWDSGDSDRQGYQEEDARLWDVVFTAGGMLEIYVNQFLKSLALPFSVLCIPRDGISTDSTKCFLNITSSMIFRDDWLIIDKKSPN